MLRFHGSRDKETFELVGHNSRLDELQAALLRIMLPHLDLWCDGRRAAARRVRGGRARRARRAAAARPRRATRRGTCTSCATREADELAAALDGGRDRRKAYYRVPDAPAARDARRTRTASSSRPPTSRAHAPRDPDEPGAQPRAGRRGDRGRARRFRRIECAGCAAGSAPRPFPSTATRSRRSRWTRGWSRWPTTSPIALRFDGGVPELYHDLFERTIAFVVVGSIAIFALFGLYRHWMRYSSQREYLQDRAGVRSLAVLALVGYVAVVQPKLLFAPPRGFVVGQRADRRARALRAADARLPRRRALRRARRSTSGRCAASAHAQDARSVLIVGAGDGGRLLLREILRNPELGYRPVGFIDDDPRKQGARDRPRARGARHDRRARARARRRRARRGADRDPVGAGHAARHGRRARAASAACRCARCRPSSSCCRPAAGSCARCARCRSRTCWAASRCGWRSSASAAT